VFPERKTNYLLKDAAMHLFFMAQKKPDHSGCCNIGNDL